MLIYERQPPPETLVRFAFDERPDAGVVRLHTDDGGFFEYAYQDMRGALPVPAGERLNTMNFTAAYLWALMQARQAAWRQQHPHDEMTFA